MPTTLTDENFATFATSSLRAAILAAINGQDIYPAEVYASVGRFEEQFDAMSGKITASADGTLSVKCLNFIQPVLEADASKSSVFVSEESSLLSFRLADGSVVSIQ